MNWMIYGANGYTGRLIAVEAVHRGMKPVLAGRTFHPAFQRRGRRIDAAENFPLRGRHVITGDGWVVHG